MQSSLVQSFATSLPHCRLISPDLCCKYTKLPAEVVEAMHQEV